MFGLGDSFVLFSLDQAVELVMNICEYKVLDEILKDISDFTQYVERLKLRLFQMSARGEEFRMEAGIANEIFRLVKPDLKLTPDIKHGALGLIWGKRLYEEKAVGEIFWARIPWGARACVHAPVGLPPIAC